MRHLTRKQPFPFICAACALALATTLTLPVGFAFAADDDQFMGGGSMGGGMGGGSMGGGSGVPESGGTGSEPGENTAPHGSIVQAKPDVNDPTTRHVLALLFLPVDAALCDEDFQWRTPTLQTLTLERAYTDDANSWECIYKYVWNEDYSGYYAIDESDETGINFGEQVHPISTTMANVTYAETATHPRDFLLRATAVELSGDTPTTTTFDPVLYTYPEGMWPTEGDIKPPKEDNGSSGGNRGGVGQGESTRVDPEGGSQEFNGEVDQAYASNGEEALPEIAPQPDAALAGENTNTGTPSESTAVSATTPDTSAPKLASGADTASPNKNENKLAAPSSPKSETTIPGFIWAVGISGVVVVTGAAIAAIRYRAHPHPQHKA